MLPNLPRFMLFFCRTENEIHRIFKMKPVLNLSELNGMLGRYASRIYYGDLAFYSLRSHWPLLHLSFLIGQLISRMVITISGKCEKMVFLLMSASSCCSCLVPAELALFKPHRAFWATATSRQLIKPN